MIDFEYWIANIIGTCELIASDKAFRKVWVDGDHTLTSIHYYDELYVQLTDGLRLNELVEEQLEAEAAVAWYGQRSPHAASRFVVELRSALESIQQNPNQSPKLAFNTRRKVLGRFPYLVVFRETTTEIEIVAVAHGRRRPGYWRARLSSTSH